MLDEDQGITTFIDPKFGEKYFMRTFPEVTGHVVVLASKHGWLLVIGGELKAPLFFNPFTKDSIQLPELDIPFEFILTLAFSGLPTSPNCIVAAFTNFHGIPVLVHFKGEINHHHIKAEYS